MSRLIDADALVKHYKRLSNECFSANNHEYSNLYDCVCAKIMTQPTAYDVDAVVEELENEKEIVKEYEKYYSAVRLDKAVDIVKRGGAE